jgi:hypothetical protein
MLDKKTAQANISLALKLAIFSVVLFASTLLIGLIVTNV